MAERIYKIVETETRIAWHHLTDGSLAMEFDTAEIHPDIIPSVLRYGAKQIIADGGASRGAEGMYARMNQLREATWGRRGDRFPDADVYRAAIAAGRIPSDSPANRDKWKSLTAAQRGAVARIPDVASRITSGVNPDDVLATF